MIGWLAAVGYGLSMIAFVSLSVWTIRVRKGEAIRLRRATLTGCLATAVWAGCEAAVALAPLPEAAPLVLGLGEVGRTIAWLHLLACLFESLAVPDRRHGRRLVANRAVLAIGMAMAGLNYWWARTPDSAPLFPLATSLVSAMGVVTAVTGLVLAERVYFGSGTSGRWGAKYLILALVALFAFDLYLYADALLLQQPSPDILSARGMVCLLTAPLFGVAIGRMKSWTQDSATALSLSRAPTMHGVALLGSGLYLLAMAASAYVVKEAGGVWGHSLQITFLVGGFLALFVALGSGRFVSRTRVYIHKAFFTYKYDYREEWRRFITMMSAHQPLALGERIIHAIANMMDSPSGALWVLQGVDDAYVPDAAWNYHGPRPSERADSPFISSLRETGWIVEIAGGAVEAESGMAVDPPSWVRENADAWLVVPLIHRGVVQAVLVLDRARAPRRLDWEDRDLLKTAAAHAASHLAEDQAAEALRTAHQFEDFNRRFAFVAHDIKNVVGQMSLMLNNAERFGDRPEFQRDMIQTVRNSTERMKTLLEQLSERRRKPDVTVGPVDVSRLIGEVQARWNMAAATILSDCPHAPVVAMAIESTLSTVIDLLVDNAIGALGPDGTLTLRVRAGDTMVMIEVEDTGPGMDPDFVRHELFRPLRSTKSTGYGIGAYQTRHMIREMGGQLEVDTAPNRGTTMRILLPSAKTAIAKPAAAS